MDGCECVQMGSNFFLPLFGFFLGKNLKYKRPKVKQMKGKKKKKKKKKIQAYACIIVRIDEKTQL